MPAELCWVISWSVWAAWRVAFQPGGPALSAERTLRAREESGSVAADEAAAPGGRDPDVMGPLDPLAAGGKGQGRGSACAVKWRRGGGGRAGRPRNWDR